MDYFQIFPLLSLAAYFIYLTYYYAAPMFCLKVLLFLAHLRYRCSDVLFTEGKITVKYEKNGEERVMERQLETDPTSRFFAMSVCAELKGMLRIIKRGNATEKGDEMYELSAGEGTRGAGRQRTEEDCD